MLTYKEWDRKRDIRAFSPISDTIKRHPAIMSSCPINTILFDLDGTIVCTEHVAIRAIDEYFYTLGIHLPLEEKHRIVGRKWETVLRELREKYPVPQTLEEMTSIIMQHYRSMLEEDTPEVPGSADAIRRLQETYTLGLVSGSSRIDIERALTKLHIQNSFAVILGRENYESSKPDPDGYLRALDLLQCHAQSTVVFEDSLVGILAARSAGLRVIAVTHANTYGADPAAAHHRIENFCGVTREWLEALEWNVHQTT